MWGGWNGCIGWLETLYLSLAMYLCMSWVRDYCLRENPVSHGVREEIIKKDVSPGGGDRKVLG